MAFVCTSLIVIIEVILMARGKIAESVNRFIEIENENFMD